MTSEPPAQTPDPATTGQLAGAVRTVSGLTLASRLLGLVRDLITARLFLDTPIGSALAAAFALPNLFRRLFGEGALSAAFIPEYASAQQADAGHAGTEAAGIEGEDTSQANAIARFTLRLTIIITAALTLLGEAVLITLLLTLPADDNRDFSLALMAVMLPFMPLVCIAAVLGGILQSHNRFAPTAAAPIVLNLCIIAAALPALLITNITPRTAAYAVAIATLLAGAIQVAWALRALRGQIAWRAASVDVSARARRMLRRFFPAVIGLGTLQLNAFLDTVIAMYPVWVGPTILGREYPLTESSNAVLFFAQRLYQFPLGVFGIAVATAVFPLLARAATNRSDPTDFTRTLARGLRLSLFIGLPASVGLALVAPDLVAVLYGGGDRAFSQDGLTAATAVLIAYAGAVWAYSLNQVLTRAFYALGDTRTPTTIAVGMVALNLALNLTLIWPLAEAGLAASTAVSATLQTLILTIVLRRRLGTWPIDRAGIQSVAKVIALTAVMAAVVFGIQTLLGPRTSWSEHAIALVATVVAGAAMVGVAAIVLRVPELRWLLARSAR